MKSYIKVQFNFVVGCHIFQTNYHSFFYMHMKKKLKGVKSFSKKEYMKKVLGLDYNQCQNRDKRPLDRDLDRNSCHRHTSVKLFWFQHKMSMEPWAVTKKFYTSVAVTPAPVHVPNQRLLFLSLMSVPLRQDNDPWHQFAGFLGWPCINSIVLLI